MIRDVYYNDTRFQKWKDKVKGKTIEGISRFNSDIIKKYLDILEERGCHYNTLNVRKTRVLKLVRLLELKGCKNLLNLKESLVYNTFKGLSIDDLKGFTAFWRWLMKEQKKLYLESKGKKGSLLIDVCADFHKKRKENSFVYLTFDEVKEIMKYLMPDEQVMVLFMFDTIIRSPTELANVKVSDLHDNFKELRIRDETSKTFGRVIKILLCSDELREYVKRNKLKDDDYLFNFYPSTFNKRLKIIAKKIWGDKMSKAGEPYSKISLYDFRHSGAIYWRLGAYKSKIDALMYRGGWNNLTILNYYTKKIGMQDSIEKQDLMIGVDLNELERLKREVERFRKVMKKTEVVLTKVLETKGNKKIALPKDFFEI